jgi:hypothetical protein
MAYSVNSQVAEKIVKSLGKAGIAASLGARHGDATVINIGAEDWERAEGIVSRVNAGLPAKPVNVLNIATVVAVGVGVASALGVLPVAGAVIGPCVMGAVVVAAVWQLFSAAWVPWRLHGRPLPKQAPETPATYEGRVAGGKVTRWGAWGCSLVLLLALGVFAAAVAVVWGGL